MRKEFRHPVLAMMGIPRLRVPSRNWLIFWSLTSTAVGAYYWDRRERGFVRDYWVNRASEAGVAPITPLEKLPKLKVYLAPPPNDFLESGLRFWRNFVKPVFTAAALDHTLVVEERQGFIRSTVANEIRDLRRKIQRGETPTEEEYCGVVVVGRGAYKEYMAGLQEGWFGPLEAPPKKVEDKVEDAKDENAKKDSNEKTEDEPEDSADSYAEYEERRQKRLEKKYPVEPPYIRVEEISDRELPPEFYKHVPPPLSVFAQPNLLGILNAPVRIYRWLNQRKLAEQTYRQAEGVVEKLTRGFLPADGDLAISEEDDWPRSFKKNGVEKDSEWMREFWVDMRLGESLSVFTDASR